MFLISFKQSVFEFCSIFPFISNKRNKNKCTLLISTHHSFKDTHTAVIEEEIFIFLSSKDVFFLHYHVFVSPGNQTEHIIPGKIIFSILIWLLQLRSFWALLSAEPFIQKGRILPFSHLQTPVEYKNNSVCSFHAALFPFYEKKNYH